MSDDSAWQHAWDTAVSEVGSGRLFAERIRAERVRRGWSQAELARKMREVGHPLDQAAISKIESPPESDRTRRIDIDEAIGFARVFGLTLTEMTLPHAKVQEIEVLRILASGSKFALALNRALERFDEAVLAVALAVEAFPGVRQQFERRVAAGQEPPSDDLPDERLQERLQEREFLDAVAEALDDEKLGVPAYTARQVDFEAEIAALVNRLSAGNWGFYD